MAKKTWKEKLNVAKHPEVKLLTFDFAGLKNGTTMLISTPLEINEYVKTIAYGQYKTVDEMKQFLAKKHNAQGVCPVTTAIFLRIVSEAAIEDLNTGKSKTEVTPFWRIVEPNSKIALKLEFGPDIIKQMRREEGLG
jgi:hypothetical protein